MGRNGAVASAVSECEEVGWVMKTILVDFVILVSSLLLSSWLMARSIMQQTLVHRLRYHFISQSFASNPVVRPVSPSSRLHQPFPDSSTQL